MRRARLEAKVAIAQSPVGHLESCFPSPEVDPGPRGGITQESHLPRFVWWCHKNITHFSFSDEKYILANYSRNTVCRCLKLDLCSGSLTSIVLVSIQRISSARSPGQAMSRLLLYLVEGQGYTVGKLTSSRMESET